MVGGSEGANPLPHVSKARRPGAKDCLVGILKQRLSRVLLPPIHGYVMLIRNQQYSVVIAKRALNLT